MSYMNRILSSFQILVSLKTMFCSPELALLWNEPEPDPSQKTLFAGM